MRFWPLLLIAIISISGCITGKTVQVSCEEAISELPEIIKENTEGARLFPVSKVLDGDTIELANGEKVRFLEINTPEKGLKWAAEAAAVTAEETANSVYLQKAIEDEDKYGRWLRYVFTNDTFVNAELVRLGLATTYSVEPNTKYKFLLSCLEQEAKKNKMGIWSSIKTYDVLLELNCNEEFVKILNVGGKPINLNGWSIKDEATHFYYFKNISLAPGKNIILYTKYGKDTEAEIYWNSKDNIWNNDGDTAFLFNENGDLVALTSFP